MSLRDDQIAELELINNELKNCKNIVIVTHISPDGDAIGSVLAFREMCLQLKNIKRVDALILGEVPDIYKFLPDSDKLRDPYQSDVLDYYDMAVALDCASLDRLAVLEDLFSSSKLTVNIDHHGTNFGYADYNIVDASACATGEILYDFMTLSEFNPTKSMVVNIYTAILTDTGGFKFGNTTARSLEVCSKLIELGVNPQYVYQECYENKPYPMVKLHAHCITNAKFSEDRKIAWAVITRDLLRSLNAKDQYIEGMIELLRQIDTVEIALLFKETKDMSVKVSFRSKSVPINELAEFFGGGGHKNASGATLKDYDIDSAIQVLLPKAQELL